MSCALVIFFRADKVRYIIAAVFGANHVNRTPDRLDFYLSGYCFAEIELALARESDPRRA